MSFESRTDAESATSPSKRNRSIDESNRVVRVAFFRSSAKIGLRSRSFPSFKAVTMGVLRFGIDGSVRPISSVPERNHEFSDRSVVRVPLGVCPQTDFENPIVNDSSSPATVEMIIFIVIFEIDTTDG